MKKGLIFLLVMLMLSAIVSTSMAEGVRYYYSGTGAIAITAYPFTSESTSSGKNAGSFEIRLHLSAGGAAGNLTVDIDSAANSKYDAALEVYDMTGVEDYVVSFDNWVSSGDAIVIAYANGGGATWGLELIWKD